MIKNMLITMVLVMYFALVVVWYGWEGIWGAFAVLILLLFFFWGLIIIARFIFWIVEWPRRRKIRAVFPLKVILTEKQKRFLVWDLLQRSLSLREVCMREEDYFYLERAVKEIDQIEKILERLRFSEVTPEDVITLNHLYGYPVTEDVQIDNRA